AWGESCRARFRLVRPPRASDEVELTLPSLELSGWVLDAQTGAPIAGAELAWSQPAPPGHVTSRWSVPASAGGAVVPLDDATDGATTVSGPDGSFQLCVPDAAAITLRASADGYDEAARQVTVPGERALEIELQPSQEPLVLRVTGPDGLPAAGAPVAIERGDFYTITATGPGGEVGFEPPPGRFRLWAGVAGAAFARSPWIEPRPDMQRSFELRVEPGGGLRIGGLAALAARAAAAGVEPRLELLDEFGEDLWSWGERLGARFEMRAGELVVGQFPPGRLRLRWALAGRVLGTIEVVVGSGEAAVDLPALDGDG
ncbi:MAG: carboxypeptidase regulatory-like domain-containing protein, partial [Acidobacteria bacterium]|nr:carboxypeptidase regulatory-like domain-containing protein [Acidobacteriota bacterium]